MVRNEWRDHPWNQTYNYKRRRGWQDGTLHADHKHQNMDQHISDYGKIYRKRIRRLLYILDGNLAVRQYIRVNMNIQDDLRQHDIHYNDRMVTAHMDYSVESVNRLQNNMIQYKLQTKQLTIDIIPTTMSYHYPVLDDNWTMHFQYNR